MKRNRLTILFIFAIIYSCSHKVEEVEKDTVVTGLIGDVKTIESKTFRDSLLVEHTKIYFDKDGFIKSKEYYQNDTVVKTESIKRNKDFRILSQKTELPNGTSQVQTYIYGSNGLEKIIQELNGVQNRLWTYENDELGRKLKEKMLIDDEIANLVRYQYESDSITRTVIYNQEGEKENIIETRITDNKTETRFKTYLTKDFTSNARIVTSLDSLSNPVKEIHFREGKKSDLFTYWYDYDEKMNWTIRFKNSNNELVNYTEREIEYYK